MKYLISKSARSKFLCVFAVVLGLLSAAGQSFPKETLAQETVDTQCIGEALASYMSDVVNAKRDGSFSDKIQLASPIFNLTNPAEVEIFRVMLQSGANFNGLDAWAGNTYTTFPGNKGSEPNQLAYEHFVDKGWKGTYFTGNKPIFFTEYGELNLDFRAGSQPVDRMRQEFQKAQSDPNVSKGGVAYFDALGTNDGYPYHFLTTSEYADITGSSPLAGAHSAVGLNTSGGFIDALKQYNGGAGLSVEILDGSQTAAGVAYTADYASQRGVKLFLRVCTGDSCAYSDSGDLISFLVSVDRELENLGSSAKVWVATGPNEPATEFWAAPECKITRDFDLSRKIPCNETLDPEYHSLRPYPASPCAETAPVVMMCAKDFVVKQSFKFTRGDFGGNCTENDGGSHCEMEVDATSDISLGLAGAKLPIMGNTELVRNSSRDSSLLDYPKRVNDYVSWYLNGTTYRAEEDDEGIVGLRIPPLSEEQKQDRIDEVINFSGPLKKLLPFAIQNGEYNYGLLGFPSGVKTKGVRMQQQDQAGASRHNQIAVCTAGFTLFPRLCYEPNINRMKDIGYHVGSNLLNPLFPFVPLSSTEDLPAKTTSLQAIGSFGAELTENPTFVIGEGDSETNNTEKTLYFPHMEESVQLGSLLQKTFLPGGNSGYTPNAHTEQLELLNNSPNCEILDTRTNPGDSLYGDLEREGETPINGRLYYTAKFECDFSTPSYDSPEVAACVNNPPADSGCGSIFTTSGRISCCQSYLSGPQECTRDVFIPLKFGVRTPNADEVWERFVVGNMSIFRRMYPKIGPGTPITEIKDIPAETSASYQANNGVSSVGEIQTTQALAGDPFKNVVGTGSLYFPHIGSLEDYFLKGIQTALRPKGVTPEETEEIPTEANCVNVPDSEIAAINPNYLGSFKSNFIDLADRWRTGFSETHNARKCFNDVVKRATQAGINPIFALTIWLNESGASNYAASSGPLWQDFGINVASVAAPQNFNAQITAFLDLVQPGVYRNKYPQCFDGRYSDLQNFMYIFHLGPAVCTQNPRVDALTYYQKIFGTSSASGPSGNAPWNWVSRGCNIPNYTNDLSCRP